MNRAGAALGDTAAILGAGQPDLLPNNPSSGVSASTGTSLTIPLIFNFAMGFLRILSKA